MFCLIAFDSEDGSCDCSTIVVCPSVASGQRSGLVSLDAEGEYVCSQLNGHKPNYERQEM